MIKTNSLLSKIAILGFVAIAPLTMSNAAMAGTTTKTAVEGEAKWLAQGPLTQYPREGGTWTYGFWKLKVRSYYTVDRDHGSTVILNGKKSRSVDTAAGRKSIAEKWAVQTPKADDRYYYRICN